jgi:nucleotide-binding universal stress UspA family protein
MAFIKKILIPFDFKEPSFNALNYGIEIARKFNLKIDLLYNVDDKIFNEPDYLVNEKNFSFSASEKLKKIDEDIQKVMHRPDCYSLITTYEVKSGDKISNIDTYVKKNGIDLVVIGSSMHETFDIEKLVRLSVCPVLSVKRFCSFGEGINDIIFASDFSENNPTITNWLKLFASGLQAKIHLLRINTPENFVNSSQSEQRMLKFKTKNGLSNCTINTYDHSLVKKGIIEFNSKIKADLIVLVTHGRSQISQWFNPSGTEELIQKVKTTPIMTFNVEIEERKGYTIKPLAGQV